MITLPRGQAFTLAPVPYAALPVGMCPYPQPQRPTVPHSLRPQRPLPAPGCRGARWM